MGNNNPIGEEIGGPSSGESSKMDKIRARMDPSVLIGMLRCDTTRYYDGSEQSGHPEIGWLNFWRD